MSKRRKPKEIRMFERLLFRNCFKYVPGRGDGSHYYYVNLENGNHISVGKDLNRMVKERLIKENNLVQER